METLDLEKAVFEVGGEDQLAKVRVAPSGEASTTESVEAFLRGTRIRLGTLLKTSSVSFLLGAGASKYAGGVLIGSIPTEIELKLLRRGIRGGRVRRWLALFYEASTWLSSQATAVPGGRKQILERPAALECVFR